jgi:hypothetical protein
MTGSLDLIGGEIKAGRVDTTNEGGQLSFGRATDNATAWYIDTYGNVASPQLRFVDVTGAAVRMTMTGSNVGIGTSTPSAPLHIIKALGNDVISIGEASSNTRLALGQEAGYTGNYIHSQNIDLKFKTYLSGGTGGNIIFMTTGDGSSSVNERMRITGAGDVCVGTNTPSYNTTNRGNITINGAASSLLAFQVGGTAKAYVYSDGTNWSLNNNASGTIYMLSTSGGVQLTSGATSWASSSDERLKNINSNIENALLKLASLRTVNFSWKSDTTNKELLGLIAQDIEQVLPQVIDRNKLPADINDEQTDETEYLSVRYTELIPVLVKAIQELSAKNTALEEILQRNNIQ